MAENTNPPESVTFEVEEIKEKVNPSEAMEEKAFFHVKLVGGLLTIFTLILSLPILASTIWLLYMKNYECEKVLSLQKLQLGIGISMILVFIVSNLVVFLRAKCPVPGLFLVMVPLTLMLIVGLALVGANRMESRTVPASPMWLKLKVQDNINWNNVKSCIYETRACDDLASRSLALKSYDFNLKKLSSIESGCCRPPKRCGMKYINATFWSKEEEGRKYDELLSHDDDCDSWGNDRNVLCYNCISCREGFVRTLHVKWWKLGVFLVFMSLTLIISHLILFFLSMWERYAS